MLVKTMYYHVWFVVKYKKKLLEGEGEKRIKEIFAECIHRHKYRVLEYETNRDHLHMLVEATDRKELSAIVRTLKAVSAKEMHSTPCFRMGNIRKYYTRKCVVPKQHFWARRYGFREVDKSEIENIRNYIRNQKKTNI